MDKNKIIELLSDMDSYEFLEIAQTVAKKHLENNWAQANEIAKPYNEDETKRLLMIAFTESI
jgi:hypothetical protein